MSASDDSSSRRHSRDGVADPSDRAAVDSILSTRPDGSRPDQDAQQSHASTQSELTIGWREWVSLPLLGIPAIKAKIDTGARTSAIHTLDIERVSRKNGQDWLAFSIQPIQRNASIVRRCEARLVDIRNVTDSGGHTQYRYFISTEVTIGSVTRTIEITLAQREDMLFRMLLGRTAMVPDIHVDPALSYTLGRVSARKLYAEDAAGATS